MSRKRRKFAAPVPEINVTPLVDVVLVLLIIFMVIAPALNEGARVDLPAIFQPDPDAKDLSPIEVTIAAQGELLLDRRPIEPRTLSERLRRMHTIDPNRHVMLKSDENIPYKRVRETFATIQDIGFRGVSLKVIQRNAAKT
ncbi:MAG: biopolymer transporter ExbD [Polyangiaceae bacterium]|nr:biopolymer transporter ExbD [Polyangiaceae bacterium]